MIEQAKQHHLAEILQIEGESFADPWSEALIARKMEDANTIFYVAVRNEEVLGHAVLQCIAPEAELEQIAVKSTARQQGIGRRLLEAVMREARSRNIETIHLEVRAGNTPAIALYRTLGFQDVGLRKNYYKNPSEDAVLMSLDR